MDGTEQAQRHRIVARVQLVTRQRDRNRAPVEGVDGGIGHESRVERGAQPRAGVTLPADEFGQPLRRLHRRRAQVAVPRTARASEAYADSTITS